MIEKDLLKKSEDELFNKFNDIFPDMIKKEQAIYIQPLIKSGSDIIKRLQEVWEIEFMYDIKTQSEIIYMKPLYKK